uniref:DUF4706 domain-containing protein n=2 Tax=Graphocephala atropunctata TaxID=36148 RepID=A0A1B6LQ57_9HEMI
MTSINWTGVAPIASVLMWKRQFKFCSLQVDSSLYRLSMEIHTQEYLRSTSILAQKIGQDLDAAREAYQDFWNKLNEEEKQQVLNEAIIDPAAVLKYANINKHVLDDANERQFSWFTRSQLNLFTDVALKGPKTPAKKTETLTAANNPPPQEPVVVENKTKENNLLNKIKNKVTNLKIPSTVEEKQSLVETKQQVTVMKSVLSKPKTPPPPPPTKQTLSEKKALLYVDNESDPDDIPKTGFDFLDNW